jgi:hypothetical protein
MAVPYAANGVIMTENDESKEEELPKSIRQISVNRSTTAGVHVISTYKEDSMKDLLEITLKILKESKE